MLGLLQGEDVLAGLDRYTAARKRVLVNTVLYLAGAHAGLQVGEDEITMPVGTLQNWKQAEWLACRVIRTHALVGPVDAADLQSLAARVQGRQIYEHLHLSHLIRLHALSPHPAHEEAVRHGLALMVDTRPPDGGFTVAVDFDIWVPSIAACALAENGADPVLLDRLAAWMVAYQADSGGWPYRPDVEQTDVDTTYTVLAFLQGRDPARYARHVHAGHRYLCQMQNDEGGWGHLPRRHLRGRHDRWLARCSGGWPRARPAAAARHPAWRELAGPLPAARRRLRARVEPRGEQRRPPCRPRPVRRP